MNKNNTGKVLLLLLLAVVIIIVGMALAAPSERPRKLTPAERRDNFDAKKRIGKG